MKTVIAFLIFLIVPLVAYAQMVVEAPNGERRIRYELCDEHHNCGMVEQTISYPICDEHHNCRTVDAFETGKARLWDEEELVRRGTFVFSAPLWQ